jgi:hypothetical protein
MHLEQSFGTLFLGVHDEGDGLGASEGLVNSGISEVNCFPEFWSQAIGESATALPAFFQLIC